jgi:MYXO-CTERM domain-containing protein
VKEELMLTRSLLIASAAVVSVSLMTAAAAAKEVESATVCGPTDCTTVDDDQRSEALLSSGGVGGPPETAEPWYRVRLGIGARGEVHDTFTINVLPKSGYVRSRDGFGGALWTVMTGEERAIYQRITAGIDPFPAKQLKGISNPKLPAANRASPAPAQPADEDEGSSATPWLIAAGALAALAGAALVRRIRRRSAPAATA